MHIGLDLLQDPDDLLLVKSTPFYLLFFLGFYPSNSNFLVLLGPIYGEQITGRYVKVRLKRVIFCAERRNCRRPIDILQANGTAKMHQAQPDRALGWLEAAAK
ncbi:MAG: hypothetical protein BGO12_05185 [Verrucomicrobia bacterium 61-8]|nr:MAG: hypothetical protein BGO12_05185 [Verrucomicrobia bacterium 61-8]